MMRKKPEPPRLDDIASAIVLTEPTDAASVRSLAAMFTELAKSPAAKTDRELAAMAKDCASALTKAAKKGAKDVESALETAVQAMEAIQTKASRPRTRRRKKAPDGTAGEAAGAAPADAGDEAPAAGPALPAPPPAPGTFTLPEEIDPEILREFLSALPGVLEEMERDILALERGERDHEGSIRRRIHTLKGETGLLGLDDVCRVCHAVEDFMEAHRGTDACVSHLLAIHDWVGDAGRAYGEWRLPEPGADAIIARLVDVAPPAASEPVPCEAPPPPVAAAIEIPVSDAVEDGLKRDEETIELIGEFLVEGEDGLAKADEVLIRVEHEGVTADTINVLFRVFHSMKGVAGFLELHDITSLAHTTETMLNACRQGTLELSGTPLNLVFDATGMMRKLLEAVGRAVKEGTPLRPAPNLDELLGRIRAMTGDGQAPAASATSAAPATESAPAPAPQPAVGAPSAPQVKAAAPAVARVEAPRVAADSPAGGGAARVSEGVRLKETIKVDLDRLDHLVEMIGELVIVESMVVNAPEIGRISSPLVRNSVGQLAKVTRDLQNLGMSMRMVPVSGVFQKMARMVRDLSQKSGKRVRLTLSGESTEMDRSMVEQIADPLVHMIRNAVDHGIEGAEERCAAGKPAEGIIRLSAYHEGGHIVIEISDDGRGMDRDAILAKAKSQGLVKDGEVLSETDILALVFKPGFSTAKVVTEISGRGVGMDVVKRNIDGLRGRVQISTVPGSGTTFKIVLPLTLAIIDGMLVTCGGERYIIPTLSVVESIKPDRSMLVVHAGRHELLNVRGEILPFLRLSNLFGLSGAEVDPTRGLAMILEGVGRRVALLVDDVLTQQQVVIKTLGSGLQDIHFVSGAAILADGRVGLILNVEQITRFNEGVGRRSIRRAA